MPPEYLRNEGLIVFELENNVTNTTVEINGVDVSADLEAHSVNVVSRDRLGSFSLDLNNYQGKYNESFNAGDSVLIYLDYADADTLQLRGKIDKTTPSLQGNYNLNIQGRARPELIDNSDLILFLDEENIVDGIKAVVDDLNNKLGYTVVTYDDDSFPDTNITLSRSFRNESYLQALRELAMKANWEMRIGNDVNGTLEFIDKNNVTKKVTTAIGSGVNVLGTAGISKDTTYVKNHIIVYGQNVEGCLTMWSEGIAPFSPWRKTEIINDTSCINVKECKDKALLEHNEKSTPQLQGTIRCTGLPNLKVGYYIEVFIAYVLEGTYQIKEYTHNYSSNGFETTIVLEQLSDISISLLQKNVERTKEQQDLNNPNNMTYSESYLFDDNTQTESNNNTNVSNGKLNLNSGIDLGTWTSKAVVSPVTATAVELRHNGNDDLDVSTFEISTDNGDNYTEVTVGTKGNPGTLANIPLDQQGKNIKVKATLKSNTDNPLPQADSIGLYWKGT